MWVWTWFVDRWETEDASHALNIQRNSHQILVGRKARNQQQGARDQWSIGHQHTPQPVMKHAVIMSQHWMKILRFKHIVISHHDSMTIMDVPMRENQYALLTPPGS